MKVLVVGGGGREDAICVELLKSEKITKLYAAPGNGGMAQRGVECVPLKAIDIEGVVNFAKENNIEYVVVAPDDPLYLGMVDALEAAGIKAFGPNKKAAEIEGSKVFSKTLMRKYGIPTADFEVFDNAAEAIAYIEKKGAPIVIKADGLAVGKGVTVAKTVEEAIEAVKSLMEDKIFGASGDRVLIEECLYGPEVSVLAFTDGKTMMPMVSSQDHKRAYDGDKGPTTGGMGTYAPAPFYTPEMAKECYEKIFLPTMKAMNEEGRTFKGVLYFGLMLTEKGMQVIEYNSRFGDPETQVVLPLLENDLFEIFQAITEERLADVDLKWKDKSAVCVVMASGGYPKSYAKGFEIKGLDEVDCTVYHAGDELSDGKLVTSGGRVLGVTAVADTLAEARDKAYEEVKKISFEGAFYRNDIAEKGLKK